MPEQQNIRGWSFVPGKPVVRGYDTSPLFREDCLHAGAGKDERGICCY